MKIDLSGFAERQRSRDLARAGKNRRVKEEGEALPKGAWKSRKEKLNLATQRTMESHSVWVRPRSRKL
jgi:hypothetical protein